jgi:hypothetical protein
MLKKIKNRISSLIDSNSLTDKDNQKDLKHEESLNNTDLEITIDWEDISNGLPSSTTNSIISNSFKRYGLIGSATPCKMVLENGEIYIPEQLSDHWEAFIGSPKIKPKTIKYINVTNL